MCPQSIEVSCSALVWQTCRLIAVSGLSDSVVTEAADMTRVDVIMAHELHTTGDQLPHLLSAVKVVAIKVAIMRHDTYFCPWTHKPSSTSPPAVVAAVPVRAAILGASVITYLGIMKVNLAGPGLTETVMTLWRKPAQVAA